MEENQYQNENKFKSISVPKQKSHGVLKTVVIPFTSGIIGASLVVGSCFGIPKIREKLFENSDNKTIMQTNTGKLSEENPINATAISLEGYSETAMGVAEKVQPSIVGIQIEYSINSFFRTKYVYRNRFRYNNIRRWIYPYK